MSTAQLGPRGARDGIRYVGRLSGGSESAVLESPASINTESMPNLLAPLMSVSAESPIMTMFIVPLRRRASSNIGE